MALNQNLLPSEPELKDLLDLFQKSMLLNLNCHHIGTIQTFDSATQKATVTINYPKTFFNYNQLTGLYDATNVDYPPLVDCVVHVAGGGGFATTYPIAAGDECLISFNDRDMDNWFQGGGVRPVNSGRLHGFPDAIVTVGIRSLPNVILNYSSSAAELRNKAGNVKVSVTGANALLQNTTTQVGTDGALALIKTAVGTLGSAMASLATDIATLCTQIEAITVTTAGVVSGVPNNLILITNAATAIAADFAKIAEILA